MGFVEAHLLKRVRGREGRGHKVAQREGESRVGTYFAVNLRPSFLHGRKKRKLEKNIRGVLERRGGRGKVAAPEGENCFLH